MTTETEVRLRVSMSEAEALSRLLRGDAAEPSDDPLLDRVGQHVGAVLGTLYSIERRRRDDDAARCLP